MPPPSVLDRVIEETGADPKLIRHIVQLALQELHFVAETDPQVTTGALYSALYNFGLPAAYHLGGILTLQDAGTNDHSVHSDSLMPETMQRMIGGWEEFPALRDDWFSLLEIRRRESAGSEKG